MSYYHTLNTTNKMNSQINGISPFNPGLGIYKKVAIGMLGYAWNKVSNEILYWTGNWGGETLGIWGVKLYENDTISREIRRKKHVKKQTGSRKFFKQ